MTYTSEDLLRAERHVAEAEQHVAHQESVITKLEAEGADTALAEQLLAEFNSTLNDHRRSRDKIAQELSQRSPM
jgi:uncharacterized coiled-coil protein SlyX